MIWICLAAMALVVLTAYSEPKWMNVLSSERNELVFEQRVRDYGAYQLRRDHPKHLLAAFSVATTLLFILAFIAGIGSGIPAHVDNVITEINAQTMSQLEEIFEIPENKTTEKPASAAKAEPPVSRTAATETTPLVIADPMAAVHSSEMEPTEPEAPMLYGTLSSPLGAGTGSGTAINTETDGTALLSVCDDCIIDIPSEMPTFPGGEDAMRKYLKSKIWLSELDIERNVSGTLWFTFVVDKNGKVDRIELLRGWGETTDAEKRAKDALRSMPDWKPGTMNGKPVNVRVRVPVRIVLRD